MQPMKIEIAALAITDDKTVTVQLDTSIIGLVYGETRIRGLSPEQAVAAKALINHAFYMGFQEAKCSLRQALEKTNCPELVS
jgi:hypothetical protein